MKKTLLISLLILFVIPFSMHCQNINPTKTQEKAFDKAGNYNDYIIKHWKKASVKFHLAADKFNQPIKTKASFLADLKDLGKTAKQSLDSIETVNVFKDNDAKFKYYATELLTFYIKCADVTYPDIVEKITTPKPDYNKLQTTLDEQSKYEKKLNDLFLTAQYNFALLYDFELK